MKQTYTNRNNQQTTFQLVLGVLLLLWGCAIYLLFRSKSINIYQWCLTFGLSDTIELLRQRVEGCQMPNFFKYSLPDGLYCASYILLMDALWSGEETGKYIAVSFIPLVAIIHEILQGLNLSKGFFDISDLFCYATPLLIYYAVTKTNFLPKTKILKS